MSERYDAIVIGTGAGGGTLAHALAASGKEILLLERGDFLHREIDNWNPNAVFVDGKYISPDTWYDADGTAFQPQVHYFVGGATKLYGAALYRLRPEDFGEISHVDGSSPAWPLSYEDFEPWYTAAEWLYQVHGNHGEDPTEGPASKPYPHPAVSHEPRLQEISDSLAGAGYHPFAAPVRDPARRERPLPQRMHPMRLVRRVPVPGPCQGRRRYHRRAPAARPAERHPAGEFRGGAARDRCRGPRGDRRGRRARRPARDLSGDVVVLSTGASNSAKILLNSANDAHPRGLANGSDQVGRNYMFHNCKAVVSLSKEPNKTVFQKTLGLNDFYLAGGDRTWPLGNIQMVGKSNAEAMKGEEPKLTLLAPRWSLDDVAEHGVDWWLTTEDLPMADNRVTVDGEGRVHLSYTATNDEEADGLYGELKTILNHVGMAQHHVLEKNFYMSMGIPVTGVGHQAGTCRFGTDPSSSVLDTDCKAHELDNLYVVDTSFFPSIGAMNPALTAMANALARRGAPGRAAVRMPSR